MSIAEFLLELRARGIELELAGDRLVARAPQGALTAELAAVLRERKPQVIAFLREGQRERGSRTIPPIRRAPREPLMPLSFTQERLWYLNQVESNPAVFNLPLCLRITGALRPDVLQRCLDEIADRHEALRTVIVVRDGVGLQRILPPAGLPLRHVDVRQDDAGASRTAALKALADEANAPFDLLQHPGVRATLVRSAEEEHFLLIATHHIFFDGVSLNLFLEELVALYEAYRAGLSFPLRPVEIQYADYAVWQREWLRGEALDEQTAFWRERLGGLLPALELPTDHPRPPIRGSDGSKEPLRIPKPIIHALSAVALAEGATTYMAMLAAFKALLHRYSGLDDVIIGTPVANRTRPETDRTIGYIANTLVLRTDCGGAPTFRQLVRRVRDGCIGAFRHQDMPFQKLVEALNPPRDLSRTPIYQVFFTYEEVFTEPPRMADLDLSRVIVGSTVARQDISIFLRLVAGEVHGSLEYSADLFTRETTLRLIDSFVTLCASAAADPDRSIDDLALLSDRERAVLSALNATQAECPESLVHEFVEAQARATPDRVALRCGNVDVNYRQLDARAEALAATLVARGTVGGDLVGVCLDRSPEMVVALLAVLKTGAAYVPIDPDFPPSRIAFILEDAKVRIVVTHRSLLGRLPADAAPLLCVDDAEFAGAVPALGARVRAGTPDDRAYVIYTSGSTGKPKGVELRHRNVANFLVAMRRRPGITADDVLVAVTTLSFDIAVLELFLPLSVGARVVIAPRDVGTDGARLAELLRAEGATIMQATPATWRMMFDAGWQGQPGLRALCGGEAVPPDLVQRLLLAVGELWNMYGPTETTVWSTCTRISDAAAPVTIGTPIANTTVRVVDRNGRQVPIGVPGEFLIGGAGVAKGYLGRPELTAEHFVLDPTGEDPTRVFYRTGDLVRVLPDGNMEFLGRSDNQVKVQGYRIELGEIEATLAALPEISEAVASVRADAPGTGITRLVAYVVFHAGRQLTASEVRQKLRERLPAYMIPGLIIELASLPRTPNGKLDRRALPEFSGPATSRAFSPPQTDAERIVAEVWSALLSVARVGRADNFFELGGHSLLSMRAVAAIEKRTGRRLDPRLMFFQTVEQLAASLASASPLAAP
jgi:amino acid adenylation domain-containing protein